MSDASTGRAPRRGSLIVLSAPSGAGKSSLVKRLVKAVPELVFSVSATTREPREGEVSGRDYHFVDRATFSHMLADGEFLEHADVHGHLYGTPRAPIRKEIEDGRDVLLEIDVQGARQVARSEPSARLVFILPPSRTELEKRIRKRGLDSADSIDRRLAAAAGEIAEIGHFHHVIINTDLDDALQALLSVLRALHQTPEVLRPQIDAVLSSFDLPPLGSGGPGWSS